MRVAVVGAGPAGCVAARRLADAGLDVVLLEAGPAQALRVDEVAVAGSPLVWPDHGPTRHTGPRRPEILRARAVGGGSAVNGLLAVAPDSVDLAVWDRLSEAAAGSARAALGRVLARLGGEAAAPGPLSSALWPEARVGHLEATTLEVDTQGVLRAWAARQGRSRRHAGVLYLADAPGNLVVETGVVAMSAATVARHYRADHVVLAAGALGTPGLVTAGLGHGSPAPWNHRGVALAVTGHPPGPFRVSAVERWSTGLVDDRADIEIVAIEGLGLIVVTLLAPDHRWPLGARDRDRLRAGVGRARARAEGVVELVAPPGGAGLAPANEAELDAWIERMPNPVHHPLGTMPLGTAVGPAGIVRGDRHVSVVDASALPEPPRADTMVPVMALAELLVEQLVHQLT